jgi:hypothetical protein
MLLVRWAAGVATERAAGEKDAEPGTQGQVWGIQQQRRSMAIALSLPDAAIETLDAKTSDDCVPQLRLVAAMKLYALGRLACRAVPASAGNGRVEFLDRLTKFGVGFPEQTLESLAQELAALRSPRG